MRTFWEAQWGLINQDQHKIYLEAKQENQNKNSNSISEIQQEIWQVLWKKLTLIKKINQLQVKNIQIKLLMLTLNTDLKKINHLK